MIGLDPREGIAHEPAGDPVARFWDDRGWDGDGWKFPHHHAGKSTCCVSNSRGTRRGSLHRTDVRPLVRLLLLRLATVTAIARAVIATPVLREGGRVYAGRREFDESKVRTTAVQSPMRPRDRSESSSDHAKRSKSGPRRYSIARTSDGVSDSE